MDYDNFTLVKDALTQHLPQSRTTPNGWIKFNCPVCTMQGEPRPDTKQRCGVKIEGIDRIGIHCFNCQFKTVWSNGTPLTKNLKVFLEAIGVDRSVIQKLTLILLKNYDGRADYNESNIVWKRKDLPNDCLTLDTWYENNCRDEDFMQVYNYAKKRGIFNLVDLYWTPNTFKGMNFRLIIPCYYKNSIYGYIARDVKGTSSRKYYSEVPENFVFNIQNFDDRKVNILVEGAIDSLLLSGISVLGNDCSQKQADVINNLNKEIIVCPDRNRAGKNLIISALDNGWSVSFPPWDKDIIDPADACERYGRVLTLKSILQYKESNPLKIRLKAKLDV